MSRPIRRGDWIRVVFAPMEGGSNDFKAIVLSMPADTGDLIYVKDEANQIHAINPASTSFERLVLLRTTDG